MKYERQYGESLGLRNIPGSLFASFLIDTLAIRNRNNSFIFSNMNFSNRHSRWASEASPTISTRQLIEALPETVPEATAWSGAQKLRLPESLNCFGGGFSLNRGGVKNAH
jgi:hypothetical protein